MALAGGKRLRFKLVGLMCFNALASNWEAKLLK